MKISYAALTMWAIACVSLAACNTTPQPNRSHDGGQSSSSRTETISDTVVLSPKAIERMGLSVITIGDKADAQELSTTGEIKADENRIFHINSLSNGRVVKDNAMLGDIIRPGQTLAVVQNLDVAKIYGDYIHQAHQNEIDTHLAETRAGLAEKNYERMKSLFDEHIAAEKDLIKAEADKNIEQETLRGCREHSTHIKAEAQAMLQAYGVKIQDEHSERIESNSLITTPRGGVIMKKTVTVGDVVSNVEPLYVVGDLSRVWLDVTVYDKQLQSIKIGDPLTFESDSLPGRVIHGRISYIKPATEDKSSTFIARAVLDNPRLELKPGMLGQVRMQNTRGSELPFVPDQALQKYGPESFVFVAEADGKFKKQIVETDKRIEGGYLIAHGLRQGDKVVSNGSFALKAEMLKGTRTGED